MIWIMANLALMSYFINAYGGYGDDGRFCEPFGDIYLAGTTDGYGAGKSDLMLVKTDSLGRFWWARTYGTTLTDELKCMEEVMFGFLAVGYTASVPFPNDPYDMLILKISTGGAPVWAKAIGGNGLDVATGAICLGNYLVSGYFEDNDHGYYPVLVCLDRDSGDILWAKGYSGPGGEAFLASSYLTYGGYALTGITGSAGKSITIVAKTDADGNLLWAKSYEFGEATRPRYMDGSSGGWLTVIGEVYGADGDTSLFGFQLDQDGNVLSSRIIESDRNLHMGSVCSPQYILTGLYGDDFMIARLDMGMNPLWAKVFSYEGNQYPGGIYCPSSSKILAAGVTKTPDRGLDFFLAYLGPEGALEGCTEEIQLSVRDDTPTVADFPLIQEDIFPTVTDLQIYTMDVFFDPVEMCPTGVDEKAPDSPMSLSYSKGILHLGLGRGGFVSVSVYDPTGRLIQRVFTGEMEKGEHEFNIILATRGVFLITVRAPEGTKTLRIIR